MATHVTGKILNREWKVGAIHPLFRADGIWYHSLKRFPGALFDRNGYVLFKTQEEYRGCSFIRRTQSDSIHIDSGISTIPGYIRVLSRDDTNRSDLKSPRLRSAAQRDEETSIRQQAAGLIKIRTVHIQLVNQFVQFCENILNIVPSEGRFDLLLPLPKMQGLLIEAKSTTEGSVGRHQLREAIGQLFDYRFTHWSKKSDHIHLALLVPRRPRADILDLLDTLHIGTIWAHNNRFAATETIRDLIPQFTRVTAAQ